MMMQILKNLNKISYLEIKDYLKNNNILCLSSIPDDYKFIALNSILLSGTSDLTFFSNNASSKYLRNTKAKACIIEKDNIKLLPKKTYPIVVDNPYKAFALVSNLFNSENPSNGIISDLCSINVESKLDKNIQIESFVNIKENCHIHSDVIIESNCSIGPNVVIEKNTVIKSNSVLSNCKIGSNCIVKSGAIIGGTGFGFEPTSKTRIQHLGDVIIKNNCNIGSNTTIDRAVFDSTIISEYCFIDNLVQIAHNVVLGKGCIMAAQSGIAGSTIVGENVIIGGQSGIGGHLNIGSNVKIAGKSGVTKNIKDNSTVAGFPAVDIKKWKISKIKLNKLV